MGDAAREWLARLGAPVDIALRDPFLERLVVGFAHLGHVFERVGAAGVEHLERVQEIIREVMRRAIRDVIREAIREARSKQTRSPPHPSAAP